MTDTDLTPADKRDELRAKIEASERRIAERTLSEQAREMAEDAAEFTKKNPLTVIGGAIAVGLVIGAMTSPGRRIARSAATGAASAVGGAASSVGGAAQGAAKSVGTAAKTRGSAFGALVTDAVIAYGIRMIDEALNTARAGQDTLEDIGDTASAKAREVKRDAGYYAGSAADKTIAAGKRTRRKAGRVVRDIKSRVTN